MPPDDALHGVRRGHGLEDAVVFARSLAEFGPRRIDEAYKTFEATRKPRASAVQSGSSANTWMRNATDPDWLYGYDAWKVPLESGLLVA
jgi:6-hydroxynicotinate 3-monooxygenase